MLCFSTIFATIIPLPPFLGTSIYLLQEPKLSNHKDPNTGMLVAYL